MHRRLIDCTAYIKSLLHWDLNFWWALLTAKKGTLNIVLKPSLRFSSEIWGFCKAKGEASHVEGEEGAKEVVEGAGSEVSKILWLRYCFQRLTKCFCVPILIVQGNAKSPTGQWIPVNYSGSALDILNFASLRFCNLWEVPLEDVSDRAGRIATRIESFYEWNWGEAARWIEVPLGKDHIEQGETALEGNVALVGGMEVEDTRKTRGRSE